MAKFHPARAEDVSEGAGLQRPRRSMRPVAGCVLLLAAALLLLACSSSNSPPGGAPELTTSAGATASVAGFIEDLEVVEGRLLQVRLRTHSGVVNTYDVDATADLGVGIDHLRVHQRDEVPVTLRMHAVNGESLIHRIDD